MMNSSTTNNPFRPLNLPPLNVQSNPVFGTTSFHDSVYLDTLNLALKTEIIGFEAYNGFQCGSKRISALIINHQTSSKELTKLIIKNSGIPNSDCCLSARLSKAVIQITSTWPTWIHSQASQSTLQRIEDKLDCLYEDLLEMSPIVDRDILSKLKKSIERNRENYLLFVEE